MAKFDVVDMSGKKVSTVELSDAVFGITPNEKAVHIAVVNFLANQRQGTQNTKIRMEVSGGGKKPWKQKGINEIMKAVGKYEQYKGVMNQLKDNLDCRESNLGLLKRSNQAEELAVQMLSALDSCIQTGKALPERLDRNFE